MIKVMAWLLACCGMSVTAAAETVVLRDVNLIDGVGGAPRTRPGNWPIPRGAPISWATPRNSLRTRAR